MRTIGQRQCSVSGMLWISGCRIEYRIYFPVTTSCLVVIHGIRFSEWSLEILGCGIFSTFTDKEMGIDVVESESEFNTRLWS